jgi:hypothetical protein
VAAVDDSDGNLEVVLTLTVGRSDRWDRRPHRVHHIVHAALMLAACQHPRPLVRQRAADIAGALGRVNPITL